MHTIDIDRFDKYLARFRILIWAVFALGIVDGLLSLEIAVLESPLREIVLACALLLFGFSAWLNVKVLEGRNWARIFYTVCSAAWLPLITDLDTYTMMQLCLLFVELALSACIVYLMFTDPLRHHFARKDAVVQPAGG